MRLQLLKLQKKTIKLRKSGLSSLDSLEKKIEKTLMVYYTTRGSFISGELLG